jgi:hypothetical protein
MKINIMEKNKMPQFDCPLPNFENRRDPGWSVLAGAIISNSNGLK